MKRYTVSFAKSGVLHEPPVCNCFLTTQLYQSHWFHAIFMPVIIEFSRCIGTYSSAKFELFNYFPTCSLYRFCSISSIAFSVSTLPPLSFTTFFCAKFDYLKFTVSCKNLPNAFIFSRRFLLIFISFLLCQSRDLLQTGTDQSQCYDPCQ